jgi:anti-sigma factor RsiW
MVSPEVGHEPNDETLVAFIDGELAPAERAALEARLSADAHLRARVEYLRGGAQDFAVAFESLFEAAPAERLAAMLERVKSESTAGRGARRAVTGGFRPALIAAGIALFLIGGALGYVTSQTLTGSESEEAADPGYWRSVVADYVALYTDETFAAIPDNDAMKSAALAGVGGKLGLDITLDKVSLPGLNLKGAIIFAYRGMPLAQIAYLSKSSGPVAFCIIANGQPDHGMAFEEREGKNIVHWAKGGRSYLVIGKLPRPALETFAASLDARVS